MLLKLSLIHPSIHLIMAFSYPEAAPSCTVSDSLTAIVEGTALNITCQVTTSSAVNWYPQMNWSVSDGTTTTSLTASEDFTGSLVQSSYSEDVAKSRTGSKFQVKSVCYFLGAACCHLILYPGRLNHGTRILVLSPFVVCQFSRKLPCLPPSYSA